MHFRLTTVRAKLTALVALSIGIMMAILPVLSWLLHKQLLDEVDDRTVDAEKSFQTELEDDIADLTLAMRVLASEPAARLALLNKDAKAARERMGIFFSVYPEMDLLFGDETGNVLAQVGLSTPPQRLSEIFSLETKEGEFRTVADHGCERTVDANPAYVIGTRLPELGYVLVCLPLDRAYLSNAQAKFGLELALVSPTATKPFALTTNFPPKAAMTANLDPQLVESNADTWAVARFESQLLKGDRGVYHVIAALDVTDIRRIVRNNLYIALGFLLLSAAISVAFGARLASIMARALGRVNQALKKLQQQEYVHVEGVKTGDELEDLAAGFNAMVDGLKERDKLRTTFGKYMTLSVVEHLLAGKVQLGGETLTVTILFTDIRSFTSISEKMDAQSLVSLLNEYFTEMVSIVMQEDGVVDKYIGDALMAVFGAPVPKPNDAVHAVRAAVRMRGALKQLNERIVERGLPPLRTGIGLHTGEVVAGNIGSEERMEYTVIGDAVNLASRLEGSTKELGVDVLISEDTYLLTKDVIVARPAKTLTVKGRAQPVMTYELLGLREEIESVAKSI